jgi:hypothetical protein
MHLRIGKWLKSYWGNPMDCPRIFQGDFKSLPKEASRKALGKPKEFLQVLVELQ